MVREGGRLQAGERFVDVVDDGRVGVHQRARRIDDHLEDLLEIGFRRDRHGDGVKGLGEELVAFFRAGRHLGLVLAHQRHYSVVPAPLCDLFQPEHPNDFLRTMTAPTQLTGRHRRCLT
ncbi:hypothetical protein D3C72_2151530 [compost metagenome]